LPRAAVNSGQHPREAAVCEPHIVVQPRSAPAQTGYSLALVSSSPSFLGSFCAPLHISTDPAGCARSSCVMKRSHDNPTGAGAGSDQGDNVAGSELLLLGPRAVERRRARRRQPRHRGGQLWHLQNLALLALLVGGGLLMHDHDVLPPRGLPPLGGWERACIFGGHILSPRRFPWC